MKKLMFLGMNNRGAMVYAVYRFYHVSMAIFIAWVFSARFFPPY